MALFPPSPSPIFSQNDSNKEDNYGKIHLFSRLPSPSSTSFARGDLAITWGDTPAYWWWETDANSRFAGGEVAALELMWWLEIRAKIQTRRLSPGVQIDGWAHRVRRVTRESRGRLCG
ncbi:unnamed protein product [Linum trigynum]|uniref:Uncharacterized protein n=1 Tax=Linum trigynum TaxID=586398 RepID=A0AAV2G1E6_9ROSI